MYFFRNPFKQLLDSFASVCEISESDKHVLYKKVTIELARPAQGELRTNVALIISSHSSMPLNHVLEAIQSYFMSMQEVEKSTFVPPGFVHLTMQQSFWHSQIIELLKIDRQQLLLDDRKERQHSSVDAPPFLDKFIKEDQSLLNPWFLLQYVLTRCYAIIRYFKETFPTHDLSHESLIKADFTRLNNESELALIRALGYFFQTFISPCYEFPLEYAFYHLQIIAKQFQNMLKNSKKDTILRCISKEDYISSLARVAVIKATIFILERHFKILGIIPLKEIY